jgi:hypothetical protein
MDLTAGIARRNRLTRLGNADVCGSRVHDWYQAIVGSIRSVARPARSLARRVASSTARSIPLVLV